MLLVGSNLYGCVYGCRCGLGLFMLDPFVTVHFEFLSNLFCVPVIQVQIEGSGVWFKDSDIFWLLS